MSVCLAANTAVRSRVGAASGRGGSVLYNIPLGTYSLLRIICVSAVLYE